MLIKFDVGKPRSVTVWNPFSEFLNPYKIKKNVHG